MAAPPYMRLYVADYLADTTHLNRGEHGAYLLLIMAMWRAGGKLPAVDAKLAAITKCSAKEWAVVKETVLPFFIRKGGQLTHKRLAAEMAKAETVSELRKGASEKGVAKRRKKNNEQTEPNGSSNADHLVPYIRHQSSEITPQPPGGPDFVERFFDQAWAAFPADGLSTTNREKSLAAWIDALPAAGGAAPLLRAVRAYAAHHAKQGAKAKTVPAFHRWLDGRRFEAFLAPETVARSGWQGPEEVWRFVARERSASFANTWLADCSWSDVPRAIVGPPTSIRKLKDELGRDLEVEGIQLHEIAA